MQAWSKLSESETHVECNKSVKIALEVLENLIRYDITKLIPSSPKFLNLSRNLRSKSLKLRILGIDVSLAYNYSLVLCFIYISEIFVRDIKSIKNSKLLIIYHPLYRKVRFQI